MRNTQTGTANNRITKNSLISEIEKDLKLIAKRTNRKKIERKNEKHIRIAHQDFLSSPSNCILSLALSFTYYICLTRFLIKFSFLSVAYFLFLVWHSFLFE